MSGQLKFGFGWSKSTDDGHCGGCSLPSKGSAVMSGNILVSEAEIARLTAERDAARDELDKALVAERSCKQRAASAEHAEKVTSDALQTAQQWLIESNEKINGLTAERDKVIKERDSARCYINGLQKDIQREQAKNDELREECARLTKAFTNQFKRWKKLSDSLQSQSTEQDEVTKERKQHVELIDCYNRQIATITTLQEELRGAENTMKERSVQERIYTTGIEALTRANVELTDKLYIADTQLSILREDLLKEREEKRQLQLTLNQLVEKLTVISKSFR